MTNKRPSAVHMGVTFDTVSPSSDGAKNTSQHVVENKASRLLEIVDAELEIAAVPTTTTTSTTTTTTTTPRNSEFDFMEKGGDGNATSESDDQINDHSTNKDATTAAAVNTSGVFFTGRNNTDMGTHNDADLKKVAFTLGKLTLANVSGENKDTKKVLQDKYGDYIMDGDEKVYCDSAAERMWRERALRLFNARDRVGANLTLLYLSIKKIEADQDAFEAVRSDIVNQIIPEGREDEFQEAKAKVLAMKAKNKPDPSLTDMQQNLVNLIRMHPMDEMMRTNVEAVLKNLLAEARVVHLINQEDFTMEKLIDSMNKIE